MDDLSKQINEEGQKYTELPEEPKSLYDLKATAIENDEPNNEEMQKADASEKKTSKKVSKKPSKKKEDLEELEVADGKEKKETTDEEIPNLDELEYADGKERDELDLIEEQEKIYGTNKLSPFKTADIRLFRRNLETMSNEKMIAIAERVAARIYSDPKSQKEELERAFVSWASRNAAFQTDMTKKAEKGARSEAFGNSASVNDLEEKLKTQSLSDLQATAARLGFNPGFDRNRLITLIKQEYQRQS